MLSMDDKEPKPIMDSYITPLVISTAGIICSTLAIAVYHCILLRYVSRRQRTQQMNNNANRTHEKNGGVQQEILNKIPIFSISAQTTLDVLHLDHNECSICLGLFEDKDEVRLLPACNHCFHRLCIDAWFIDHANCPVCRSPITCDCELALPVVSQNVTSQQGVLQVPLNIPSDHHHHHHHPLINHDVSGSISRFQRPRPVLLHSFSLSSHMRKKPLALNMGLKRSLSLDQSSSYIAITIQRNEGEAPTSSTKRIMMSEYNSRSGSLRHVDLMPWVLTRSFSQFRNTATERYNGILPN
ncbi:hypothetical protein VNO77_17711 [Canavalia gladiata]|uniref:RING-type E3 ubiquitin transferase n=1 Tax=Canavalia gladiata TaxID=3824 RepID=A0AAN9LJF3_CANGL